ncbi:MAG: ATP-binding cassette domain-containing protein [Rhizobiales bacterium]|nr:ATP-binding cassette domain-containing protein [Hyphomicrobiales bacterium]
MIEISGVSKRYGETVVVDDVSLTIPKGGITSIIGPNGAGKSTLLSVIARILAPDAGKVTVDELDVATTPGRSLARRLSFMRQDNHLTARLSVRDLVAFGRYPYSGGRLTAEDVSKIDESIGFVGLDDYRQRFLDELSGGQRQRAFVAMLLAQDTDYALFDEPLNNLDMRHAVATMKLLRRMADEFGKTIVIVLHDINFASAYSDQIVAMREGRVLHVGSVEHTIFSERLKEVFDIDVSILETGGRRIVDFYA